MWGRVREGRKVGRRGARCSQRKSAECRTWSIKLLIAPRWLLAAIIRQMNVLHYLAYQDFDCVSCSSSGMVVSRPWLNLLFSNSDERTTFVSTRQTGSTSSAARVERRFVRLSFSRVAAATSTSTSGATTSTRACANLAPRTTNRGLELGACLPPLLVNAEERRHERETTPSFPFSVTWGKRKLRRAVPAIYRMARSAKILQGSSLL